MALENKITEFNEYFIGMVLDFDITTRKIAAHIPKLMPAITSESAYSLSAPTSTNANINNTEFSPTIKTRNSFWVSAWNVDSPMPKVGSKIAIFFIDGNPKTGYWVPFNANGLYDVIDEEKYRELYTMQVGDRQIIINEQDKVQFTIPNSVNVVYNEENKTKRINLIFTENYIISDSQPIVPFDGMMWYNSDSGVLSVYKNLLFRPIIINSDTGYEAKKSFTKIFTYNDITAAWLRIAQLDPYVHKFNNATFDINTYNIKDDEVIPMSSSTILLTTDFRNNTIPYSIRTLYNENQGYLRTISNEMARAIYSAGNSIFRYFSHSSYYNSSDFRYYSNTSISLTAYHAIPFPLDFSKITSNTLYGIKTLSNVLLEEIILPATIRGFSENSLYYCYSLHTIICQTITPPVFPFSNTRDLMALKHIYVPASQLSWYGPISISLRSTPPTAYWLGQLYKNTSTGLWNTGVILPVSQPPIPVEGSKWFNETTDKLFTYSSGSWDAGISLPTTQPSSPADGAQWFQESTNKLFTYSFFLNSGIMKYSLGNIWVEQLNTFTSSSTAPSTIPSSIGDYHLNTSTRELYVGVQGGVDGYKVADGWCYFASIIEEIPV